MKIFSANFKGQRHHNCDDSVYVNEKNKIAAVADGVGSAKNSRFGSRRLADGSGEYFTPLIRNEFKVKPYAELKEKTYYNFIMPILNNAAAELDCTVEDVTTTFICAFDNDDTLTVIHCGDGAVIGVENTEQERIVPLSLPDNDDFDHVYSAENKDTPSRMRIINVDKKAFKIIILATDGFTEPFISQPRKYFSFGEVKGLSSINNDKELIDFINKNHIKSCNVEDDISAVYIKIDSEDIPEKNINVSTENAEPIVSPVTDYSNDASGTVVVKKNSGMVVFMALILSIAVALTGLLCTQYKKAIVENKNNISSMSSSIDDINKRLHSLESEKTTVQKSEKSNEKVTENDSNEAKERDSKQKTVENNEEQMPKSENVESTEANENERTEQNE